MRDAMERLVLPVIAGIASSLIANWIAGKWGHLSAGSRWGISLAVGFLTVILIAVIVRAPKNSVNDAANPKVASELKGTKDIRVKGIDVVASGSNLGDVASDISSKDGDIDISNVKVRHESKQKNVSDKD